MKPEGIFKNEDLWYGEQYQEENKWWYIALDKEGNTYETNEVPERFPFICLNVFPENTEERFVLEYALALKIGEKRFGSECKHERSKRGYCPDCLRKVR